MSEESLVVTFFATRYSANLLHQQILMCLCTGAVLVLCDGIFRREGADMLRES